VAARSLDAAIISGWSFERSRDTYPRLRLAEATASVAASRGWTVIHTAVPRETARKTKSNNGLKDVDETKTCAIESVALSTSVELTAGRGTTYAAFPVFRLQGRLTSSTAAGSRRGSSPRAPCPHCLVLSVGVADRWRNTTVRASRVRRSPLEPSACISASRAT